MHPENGPRCTLRAFAKASHNRKECGQDIAPACKPPHATATVVLEVVLPNRTVSLPLTFTKEDTFSPNTDRMKFERHLSGFNEVTVLSHLGRAVLSHQSHRSFALLTSIFHTFPVTHSLRALSNTGHWHVGALKCLPTLKKKIPLRSRHLSRDQMPLAITKIQSISHSNTWMNTRSSYG